MNPEFEKFKKIPRWSRDVVITEKIDGTNAQIYITEDGQFLTGSRNRWITPENDNFGFSRWAHEHEEELREGLGVGRHYGEWWGRGIQRGYGMDRKVFSLFNTSIWNKETKPDCCEVVPVLYSNLLVPRIVEDCIHELVAAGSYAAPGFMNPEGIIIYHVAAGQYFKKTCKNDEKPKGIR